MTQQARNRIITFTILLAPFIILLVLVISAALRPPPPPPPLPNPNGYAALIDATRRLSTNGWNYEEMNLAQLRELAAANAGALALAQSGLSNQCRVPVQATPAYDQDHLADLAAMKRLAQAMLADGKLAERENRPNDAARSYLAVIQLGIESLRGGTVIDALVGLAIESLGAGHLQAIVDQLDAPTCRTGARTLELLDSQRETWSDVRQQESDWSRRRFTGLRYEIVRLTKRKSLEKNMQRAEQKFQEQQLKTGQLLVNLAARAYSLDKGHSPAHAEELVPEYLQAVPQDPFTGAAVVYAP